MLKKSFLIGLCLISGFWINGQELAELSLLEAYALFEQQYPSLQNAGLMQQIYDNEIEQLDIAKLPSLTLYAEGRLQSESVSSKNEGAPAAFNIDLPLYNLRSYAEAQYLVLDGGINDAQRKLKEVQLAADLQNIEIDKYSLRERINVLFLNISQLREQSKLFDISLRDLQARKDQIRAGLEAGVILESELIKVEVRELELQAQQNDISFKVSGLIETLSTLIGAKVSEEVKLIYPALASPLTIPDLNRPEQKLFQLQKEAILARSDLISAQRKPKLSAYAQLGIGYPNQLNFLDENVSPYGVIGAQLSWKITDWKKNKRERELLSLQAQQLQNAEATFDFNLNSKEGNYREEVKRLQAKIETDQTIAQLQTKVLNQLAAQLDEGVITSSDYIIQVNAELAARQNVIIHQIELLKTQLEFWNERGALGEE